MNAAGEEHCYDQVVGRTYHWFLGELTDLINIKTVCHHKAGLDHGIAHLQRRFAAYLDPKRWCIRLDGRGNLVCAPQCVVPGPSLSPWHKYPLVVRVRKEMRFYRSAGSQASGPARRRSSTNERIKRTLCQTRGCAVVPHSWPATQPASSATAPHG